MKRMLSLAAVVLGLLLVIVPSSVPGIAQAGTDTPAPAQDLRTAAPGAIVPDTIRSGAMFWDYRTGNSATGPVTILTVSADKIFVLTDIVVSPLASQMNTNPLDIKIYEDATLKSVLYEPCGQIHFSTGIPFAPGSNIIISQPRQGPTLLGNVVFGITITGYEYSELNSGFLPLVQR